MTSLNNESDEAGVINILMLMEFSASLEFI